MIHCRILQLKQMSAQSDTNSIFPLCLDVTNPCQRFQSSFPLSMIRLSSSKSPNLNQTCNYPCTSKICKVIPNYSSAINGIIVTLHKRHLRFAVPIVADVILGEETYGDVDGVEEEGRERGVARFKDEA
jgi:hypothetical protein